MSDCPACRAEPLVELEAAPGAHVELCRACKGMLLDIEALEQLAGGDCRAAMVPRPSDHELSPCLRCNTTTWETRELIGADGPALYVCGACRMVWLLPGQLDRLRASVLSERRRARSLTQPGAADESLGPRVSVAPALASADGLPPPGLGVAGGDPRFTDPEPFDRVSFEHGTANWLAAPVALVLALLFCMTPSGRFFGSLVGMPFHELGHALTSWLSSRFAVPLPFFTVWNDQQSVAFGLVVAVIIAAFGVRSWLERRRFGVALAGVLLALQLGLSWLVPARLTSMLQILGGALGEIVLGALVLVAFHFPLPDRLRWDFWRWPALVPGSVCLANALLLWLRAARDVRHMPWGSAIGDESDGDMNRLVNGFGWRARELSSFYLKVAVASVVVLALAQLWAWYRARARASSAGAARTVAAERQATHAKPPEPPFP